jgi:predicted DNA-binding WGR domain protein
MKNDNQHPLNGFYLEKLSHEKNMLRFYRASITQTLFGDWALVREWGRIGSHGAAQETWFSSEASAVAESKKVFLRKIKRGYVPLPVR